MKLKQTDSTCWKTLLKVREYYLAGRKLHLSCGNLMRLWNDDWDEANGLLSSQFPELFEICLSPDITIKEFVDAGFMLHFRRQLNPNLLVQWRMIRDKVGALLLSNELDHVSWVHNKSTFTLKSLYTWQERFLHGAHNKWIGRQKILLKFRSFCDCRSSMLCLQGIVCVRKIGQALLYALSVFSLRMLSICSSSALCLNWFGGPWVPFLELPLSQIMSGNTLCGCTLFYPMVTNFLWLV